MPTGRFRRRAWLALVSGMVAFGGQARAQEDRWRQLHEDGTRAMERGNLDALAGVIETARSHRAV